jgi:hypothetical protein
MGLLRIPKEIELAGLDVGANAERFADEQGIINAERTALGAGSD